MKPYGKAGRKTLFLARAAIIAALYVMLTLVSALLGLDGKGLIQVRLSEALCVLPFFTSAAVPGVTVGCLIYNLLFASPIDAVFGTLATLIGVLITRHVPPFNKNLFLASVPTVVSNSVIIPFIVVFAYTNGELSAVPLYALFVAIGEIISCSVLGSFLLFSLKKHRYVLFGNESGHKKGNQ